jgi:HEAT repeat protein
VGVHILTAALRDEHTTGGEARTVDEILDVIATAGDAGIAALISLFDHQELSLLFPRIAGLLGTMGKSAVNPLVNYLQSSAITETSVFAIIALGYLRSDALDACDDLANILNEAIDMRAQILVAMAKIGCNCDLWVQGAISLCEDAEHVNRKSAVYALGWMPICAKSVSATLIRSLKDGHEEVRAGAAHALGAMDSASDDIVSHLEEALHDESEAVRNAAREALLNIRRD